MVMKKTTAKKTKRTIKSPRANAPKLAKKTTTRKRIAKK